MKSSKPHVRLTKREQKKLFDDVKKALEKPKLSGRKKLLFEIFETADLMSSKYYYPGKSSQDIKNIRKAKEFKDLYYGLKTDLLAMKQQKLIEIEERADSFMVVLSAKGRMKALRELAKQTDRKLPNKERIFVIYDFPEHVRKGRRVFRMFLRQIGFSMEQKSVWSTDKDVLTALLDFLNETEIKPWVLVIVGEDLLKGRKEGCGKK